MILEDFCNVAFYVASWLFPFVLLAISLLHLLGCLGVIGAGPHLGDPLVFYGCLSLGATLLLARIGAL